MRKTFIALLAGVLLAACAEKAPERGALILGEATGFNPQDTIVAFFSKFEGKSGRSIARDTLRDGHFRFRLDSLPEGAEYYSLSFEKIKNGKFEKFLGHGSRIYLEPGVRVRMQGEGRYYKNAQTKSPLRDQKLHDRFNEDGYDSWRFTRLALSDYPNPDTDAFFEAYRNWEIIDDKFIADAKADAKEIRHIRFSLYARYAGDSEDTPVLRSSEMLIIRNDSGTFVMG